MGSLRGPASHCVPEEHRLLLKIPRSSFFCTEHPPPMDHRPDGLSIRLLSLEARGLQTRNRLAEQLTASLTVRLLPAAESTHPRSNLPITPIRTWVPGQGDFENGCFVLLLTPRDMVGLFVDLHYFCAASSAVGVRSASMAPRRRCVALSSAAYDPFLRSIHGTEHFNPEHQHLRYQFAVSRLLLSWQAREPPQRPVASGCRAGLGRCSMCSSGCRSIIFPHSTSNAYENP